MIARALAATTLIAMIGAARAHAQSAGAGTTTRDAGAVGSGTPRNNENAAPAPTLAPAPDNRASHRPETVDITLVGSTEAYSGLRARIGDRMLSGVPLLWSRIDRFNPLAELLRGPPAARATTALRCWVDLADLRRATLYFADQRGERFLVRELPLSGRFDEVDQQSVAQVMELSISALIENEEIGFTRAQAREIFARVQPAPAPSIAVAAALATATSRWRMTAGASYSFADVGAALPIAQGPGLILALGRERGQREMGGWIAAQYQLPIEARQTEVGVRLQTLNARIGIEARWWRLQARVGAGANFTHVTPLSGTTAATTVLAAPHWSTSWLVTGAVAARLPLERALRDLLALSLVLFLDAVPSTTQYRFEDSSGAHLAFAPRRLRPGLALELAY